MPALMKIPKKQLLYGMNLALKNARSLLKEAELLAENRAYSRAFVLCTLSLEEAGKTVLLALVYGDEFMQSPKSKKIFWKIFRNHSVKIRLFEDFDLSKWKSVLYVRKAMYSKRTPRFFDEKNVMKQYLEKIKTEANIYDHLAKLKLSSINDLKFRCLYVDFNKKHFNFYLAYKPPPKIVKALLQRAKKHISDTQKLRDTVHRSRRTAIREELFGAMFKLPLLQNTLKELEKLGKREYPSI